MDVGYADNAGAITCHLIGDEKLFGFARCVKSSLQSAYFWCVDFRDPTAFSRFRLAGGGFGYWLLHHFCIRLACGCY